MEPTDAVDDIPDIVLAIDENVMKKYKEFILSLKNGQIIEF